MPTSKKSVHKNATRSRHLIKQAFAELLNEKDINKITVTDIVERANISRGTFYAHYLDVYDLYTAIQNNIIEAVDELFNELGIISIATNPTAAIERGVFFLEANKSYFKLFAVSSYTDQLVQRIENIIIDRVENDFISLFSGENANIMKCHIQYAIGGIENVILKWFSGELPIDANKLTEYLSEVCLSHRPQFFLNMIENGTIPSKSDTEE